MCIDPFTCGSTCAEDRQTADEAMMLAAFLVAVWYSLHLGVSVYALCVGNSGAAPCLLGMCVCTCMKTCAGMQAEIGGLGSTSNGEAALMRHAVVTWHVPWQLTVQGCADAGSRDLLAPSVAECVSVHMQAAVCRKLRLHGVSQPTFESCWQRVGVLLCPCGQQGLASALSG